MDRPVLQLHVQVPPGGRPRCGVRARSSELDPSGRTSSRNPQPARMRRPTGTRSLHHAWPMRASGDRFPGPCRTAGAPAPQAAAPQPPPPARHITTRQAGRTARTPHRTAWSPPANPARASPRRPSPGRRGKRVRRSGHHGPTSPPWWRPSQRAFTGPPPLVGKGSTWTPVRPASGRGKCGSRPPWSGATERPAALSPAAIRRSPVWAFPQPECRRGRVTDRPERRTAGTRPRSRHELSVDHPDCPLQNRLSTPSINLHIECAPRSRYSLRRPPRIPVHGPQEVPFGGRVSDLLDGVAPPA